MENCSDVCDTLFPELLNPSPSKCATFAQVANFRALMKVAVGTLFVYRLDVAMTHNDTLHYNRANFVYEGMSI